VNILKYIAAHWSDIGVVVSAIAGVVVLYKRGETAVLKEILFRLVTQAEQEFGPKTGELKKAAVIEWLYEKMPAVMRLIVTKKEIEALIDEVLAYAKSKWATNEKLKEYVGLVSAPDGID
jgi:hypothetical protein